HVSPAPRPILFPYTTLFRSWRQRVEPSGPGRGRTSIAASIRWGTGAGRSDAEGPVGSPRREQICFPFRPNRGRLPRELQFLFGVDRKSTRLNSSHGSISYAV